MARDNEKPQRTIKLPEFWIGRTPVTNVQYKRFIDANPEHRVPFSEVYWADPYNWDDKSRSYQMSDADYPVVLIDWDDARAFCDWAGLVLPTEEQWEKSARGADGRVWPWGDDQPTDERCNFNRMVGGTTAVGRYSPKGDSPYGCMDMAGNVWEVTASWYKKSLRRRVVRGGSWYSNQDLIRNAYRGDYRPDLNLIVGFRAVELLSDPAS